MTTMLEVKDASKRYGEQLLLDNASVALPDNCKIGMVGRNGAGKSTLIRALVGSEDLDSGQLIRHPRLRLGYLRQHDPFQPGESVMDFLQRDSKQADWRCGEVAAEFAIKGPQLERPVSELSGGWQTRVKLAALLLHYPNLLLLDEPTNFLDLSTQILLEHFLKHFSGGILIVSHDRGFLKSTCTHTLELSRGKLTLFPSNIETYIEYKQERREHDQRVNAATLVKRKQLETFINRNRANANTASQARNKQKQLDRLELLEMESEEKTVSFHVPQGNIRRGTAVRCRDLSIGYDDHPIATHIDLEIEHGTCTVIVGDNGQGKTTLLRSLVASLPALHGEVSWGYGCEIGVYAQHVYTSLPERETILDYLDSCRSADTSTQTCLDVAGSFLFHGDTVNKPIKVLSGGERARLCLAGLLLAPHNVLVLDEPGNHLDVETVEALADALNKYEGTVLLTSHDRHFVHRVANSVIEIRDGKATHFPADYDTYLYRIEKEFADDFFAGTNDLPASPTVVDKQARKTKSANQRSARKEVSALERKIAQLDERRRSVNEQLLSTTDVAEAQRLHDEVENLKAEIDTAEQRWFELQEMPDDA
ncbi:MAG TPA: ABC-F family ATP-binding cassette domain-containing protein [Pirellulales bacterium]|nr:ABC-F family ATP-binding cassette domain-containing protein [Pirellulales bacterium]